MMNLYNLHTNPEQLEGYENRLRIPQFAYEYGEKYGFTDELVSAVAKDPESAYWYAKNVIKDRWPEAEPVIAKDPKLGYWYARFVIEDRWPEAEPAIATDHNLASMYAKHIIKGRWPEGEAAIAKDPFTAYAYALRVIRGRFPEGEPAIATDPIWAEKYERDFGTQLYDSVGGNEGEKYRDEEGESPPPKEGNKEGNADWDWTDPYHSSGEENAVLSNTP